LYFFKLTEAFGTLSADKLREKAGKAAGLSAGQGIGNFCVTGSHSDRVDRAKRFQPAAFSALCVKGLCGKEAFLLTDLFTCCLFFIGVHEVAALSFLVHFCIQTKRTSVTII
jgi:hypothetical protein